MTKSCSSFALSKFGCTAKLTINSSHYARTVQYKVAVDTFVKANLIPLCYTKARQYMG